MADAATSVGQVLPSAMLRHERNGRAYRGFRMDGDMLKVEDPSQKRD